MRFTRKKQSIFFMTVMLAFVLPNMVFADNGDVYNQDGTIFAKAAKATLDVTTRAKIGIAPEKFYYEFGGKFYNQTYIDKLFDQAVDKSGFTRGIDLTKGIDKIGNGEEQGDLEVEAIE